MSKQTVVSEITDLFIQSLKDDVMHWQKKALAALKANDDVACREALNAQDVAIQNLIKLAETKQRLASTKRRS